MQCPNCGKEIPDGFQFCPECGNNIHKPTGNVRTEICFFDKDGNACEEENAVRFIGTMYDKDGNRISETWGDVKKKLGESCKTKYPLVLIHGAGFRDLKWPVYWGRIPSVLEKEGAKIYYGLQDCWASIETNAEMIAKHIDEILLDSGSTKVNIIAHSKGGLDARMAATSFGCGEKIASITTIATPHHGSKTIDKVFCIPRPVWNIAAFAVNNWIRIVGDKKPDFLKLCEGFTTESMRAFNENNPDVPGIYYQSFACVMSHPFSDINLSTANAIIKRIEGENDGLVSVESARWGENFSILRSNAFRGISHLDAIDLRRHRMTKKKGDGVSDICDVYIQLVRELKEKGF